MFENLKKLIFEEDLDEEEEEVVPVRPVKKQKVQKSAPVYEEPARPTMQRIDVTQPIKTPVVNEYQAPVNNTPKESVFRQAPATPTYEQKAEPAIPTRPVQQERQRSASLTIDDIGTSSTTSYSTSRPKTNKVTTQKPVKKQVAYEFNPVISPIFGVDEKDVTAVQNTGKSSVRKATSSKKGDEFVSKVISPMYGINKDDQPSTVQKTVEKSNKVEEMTVTKAKVEAEEEIPEFSLDDILNGNGNVESAKTENDPLEDTFSRMKQVAEEETVVESPVNAAPPTPKKKPVFDSATLFDDDED